MAKSKKDKRARRFFRGIKRTAAQVAKSEALLVTRLEGKVQSLAESVGHLHLEQSERIDALIARVQYLETLVRTSEP